MSQNCYGDQHHLLYYLRQTKHEYIVLGTPDVTRARNYCLGSQLLLRLAIKLHIIVTDIGNKKSQIH